jgi:hypothetical protein
MRLLFAILVLALKRAAAQESAWFEFSSGVSDYDVAYRLAMSETSQNSKGGVFVAGAGWNQLWTRDTAYSVELGAGLVRPDLAKKSLQQSIQRHAEFGDVWLQDVCGHFGGWPTLSDAIVGVRGAWSLYSITGDVDFLGWAYGVTTNSLKRAEREVYDETSGLFKGCSSFMESNGGYPEKYSGNGELVGKTKALSTNMLYYVGYKLGSMMAKQLGKDDREIQDLIKKAEQLRDKIRTRLWSSHHGYYSYFEDENNEIVPQMEGLGAALVLLSPDFELDSDRIKSIFRTTHRTERGLPCLWPRFNVTEDPDYYKDGKIDYYHNGRIWPFVQGYWALAAARHDQVAVFAEEFANLVWLSQQGQTFAEFYELDGTFPKQRRRQLWSDTGFLSMVFHGLFGLTFLPHGVQFDPLKPASPFAETISLQGVVYREMTLNIFVSGSGSRMTSITVDGTESPEPFIPGDLKGTHTVVITLEQEPVAQVAMAGDLNEESVTQYSIKTRFNGLALVALMPLVILIVATGERKTILCNICRRIVSRGQKRSV